MGSCALIVVVRDNQLYVANLGDSKARLYRRSNEYEDNKPKYSSIKVSRTHNAGKPVEQEKLKKEFVDRDILVSRDNRVFYVKGRLQPTRVILPFMLESW